MSNSINTNLLIIGAGPAGYTAAIYAARANLKPHLVAGLQPGGQLMITTDVENYPGFAAAVQGPWLMEQMQAQAEHVGTQIHHDLIASVDFSSRPFKCVGDSGTVYLAQAVIIATGAQARWLGLPSEQAYQGFGISACATCDGFFFKGKDVAVVGGGNSAMEEALYLANICNSVTLIHRRNALRGEKILQDRVLKHAKIKMLWDHEVIEALGTSNPTSLTHLKLKNTQNGAVQTLPFDGLFVAIGHDPATAVFKGHVAMDDGGYILTKPDSTATNIAGVYAAGDVKDKVFRQAVTAAGTGCMAALEADKWLAEQHSHAAAAE